VKKILILTYDFPPYVSVGGLRPYSWYKFLKDYDIYPIIITRQWENKYGSYLDYISPSESLNNITEVTDHGTIIKAPHFPNLSNKLLLKYGDSRYIFIRKIITAYFEFGQFLFLIGPRVSLYLLQRIICEITK